MGIQTEFNPDLALRNIAEFHAKRRDLEECIPEILEIGKTYSFIKEGQRNYWMLGEMPLLQTEGNQQLSKPLASIRIIEATHFVLDGTVYTKGTYRVVDVFDSKDQRPHFNGLMRIRYDTLDNKVS